MLFQELNLSGCGLQDMDYFTPWNSNHLEVVDLSNNKLPSVPSNLQFFHKLKKLYLDGNPITRVAELPFALLWNMQVLSMAGCQVATIADDPFRNMDKLKEVSEVLQYVDWFTRGYSLEQQRYKVVPISERSSCLTRAYLAYLIIYQTRSEVEKW